jgi:hypothetical protein
MCNTHVKTTCNKPAADLNQNAVSTTCNQDVRPACSHLAARLLTEQTCYKLFQQVVTIRSAIQQLVNKL